MLGDWSVEVSAPNGQAGRATSTIQRIMSGRAIREDLVTPDDHPRQLWIHAYDVHGETFRSVRLDDFDGAMEVFTGTFGDGLFRLTKAMTETRHVRISAKKVDENAFEQKMELSTDGGQHWRSLGTARYSRVRK